MNLPFGVNGRNEGCGIGEFEAEPVHCCQGAGQK
jgi:hypothetical protein